MQAVLVAAVLAVASTACASAGQRDIEEASPPAHEEAEKPTDSYGSEALHVTTEHIEELGHQLATAIDTQKELSGDTADQASALLDDLDLALRSHVPLLAIVTDTAIRGNPEQLEAADTTLEEDLKTLVFQRLGPYYDRHTLEELEGMRRHESQAIIVYAQAAAKRDEAGKSHARDQLAFSADEFAAFTEKELTSGGLKAPIVKEQVRRGIDAMLAIVDAQAASSPGWFGLVEPAVEESSSMAKLLAEAIDEDKALQGQIDSKAAEVLAELNGRLFDHVYAAGFATRAILREEHEAFPLAADRVSANTAKLVELFRSNYDEETARGFQSLWEHHVGLLYEHAEALRADDAYKVEKAKEELASFSKHFGEFMAEVTADGVKDTAVEERVNLYIEGFIEAVREQGRARGG